VTVCLAVAVAACTSDSGAPASNPSTPAGSGSAAAGGVAASVSATAQTEPVPHDDDAADDPAVWANPDAPEMSAVIGTDKRGGLLVYDLAGRELQYLDVGRVNNVDVRPAANSLTLAGRPAVLAVATTRSSNSIGVFELDPGTRRLRDVAAEELRPGLEVSGSCLYRSARTGKLYEFVNSEEGEVEQWELFDDGSGRVAGQRVRSLRLDSETEGCVADDELGTLYLAEQARGIWAFGAEPDAGDRGTLVDEVSSAGPLVADVEGLSLTYGADGTGHLFASCQGDNSFAVYRRDGDNAYVGSFRIDGVEDTDGIDVTTAALGPSFPSGVFVAQDGRNGDANQNFKLVPLQSILTD